MWIQRELDQVREQIQILQNPVDDLLVQAQRDYPTLFGREFYLMAPNGVKVVLSPFDRSRIVDLILSGASKDQVQALITEVIENAGFYDSEPDGDVKNPRLFGTVMMFPFNNTQQFIDGGINFSSSDSRAIKIGDETLHIKVGKKTFDFNFRSAMIQTANDFFTHRVLDIWTNLGPALKSWWSKEPDPFWVATLGYYRRRVAVREWIRKNKSKINNLDEARQWFKVNWPAVCLVENDFRTIGEDWSRIIALETGYTLNMMQQRSNVFVYDQSEVDAEKEWVKSADQRQEAWINQLNEDEKALINGITGNILDGADDILNKVLIGLGLVAVILIAK